MKGNPFKFLDSYTRQDKEIFFGRDREIEEMYQKVFEGKMLLVYGISGTGKTSLINCGLANKFEDSDWLPVTVRRGRSILDSLVKELQKNAIPPSPADAGTPPGGRHTGSDLIDGRSSPARIVKSLQSIYLDHFKPIYLIFDQFEELFIFGDREERENFIQVVKAIVDSDVQCRLIFSIREEYLASVTEFELTLTDFLANRMRVEKMTHQHAVDVIEGPCRVHGIEVEEGFSEALLNKLNPESNEVELTYLQVFLDKVFKITSENIQHPTSNVQLPNKERKKQNRIEFAKPLLEKVGDVSDLLGAFLEEQISALDDPDIGLAILKSFVSLKGTRKQISGEEIQETAKTFGQDIPDNTLKEYLQQFVNLRILKDKDETGRYELRHDSLADKIYEKITLVEKELLEIRQFLENALDQYEKRKIYLTGKDLKYIAPYEDKLFVNKETEKFIEVSKNLLQKAKKRIKRIAIAGFLAILLILAGTIFTTFELPLGGSINFLGKIIYVVLFLPLFSFYVIRTKENRTINLLFLLFTLIFLSTIYLFNTKVKRELFKPVFITEEKLQNTIDNLSSRNTALYNDIGNLVAENPETTGDFKIQTSKVIDRTDELFDYIEDIKIEIVSITEGIDEDELIESGINIEQLKRIDDKNIPFEILIGPSNNGKAFDLKAAIIDYKEFVSEIVKGNPTINESLEKTLKTDNPIGEGVDITWEHYNFEGLSVGFVITTLSKIQSEIKYAELEVLSYLNEQVSLAVTEVARKIPSVVVSPLKMNVLYIGIDNPLNIAVPGLSMDRISATATNGRIIRQENHFTISPYSGSSECQIFVTAEIDGMIRRFSPIPFRVKSVPDPVATIGGIFGGRIQKEELLQANGIKATISSEFDFDILFYVSSFRIGVSRSGFLVEESSNNNMFTENQLELLRTTKNGELIWIMDIRAIGPDGSIRELNGIILTVVE